MKHAQQWAGRTQARLIAVHVAGGAQRNNMCALREHLVEHGAVVLAVRVLVKRQLNYVLELERFACRWVAVQLLYVGHNVGDVVHGAIQRARLPARTTAYKLS